MSNYIYSLNKWVFIVLCMIFTQQVSAQVNCTISGPSTVCSGSKHIYYVSPPANATNAEWIPTSNCTIANPSLNSAVVIWGNTGPGGFVVKFSNSSNTIISSCSFSANVLPLPDLSIYPNIPPQTCFSSDVATLSGYCQGQEVIFNATGGANYRWSVSGAAELNSPSNQASAAVRFKGTGIATVCVTGTSAAGCERQLCQNYTVYQNPTARITVVSRPNATDNVDICRGDELTFLGNYNDPNGLPSVSYSWSAINTITGISIGGGSDQNFSQLFENPGNYVVTLKVSNCLGCVGQHTMNVHVHEHAGAEITCVSVACEGIPAEYCAPLDCVNPTWTLSGHQSYATTNRPECIEVVWGMPSSGYGNIQLVCSGSLCPFPASIDIPIIPKTPKIQGPTLICNPNQKNIVYSLPYWPGTIYEWSASNGVSGSSQSNAPNIFVVDLDNFNSPGFFVNVTITNTIAGCQASGSLTVDVKQYNINVSPTLNYCFGFTNGAPTFTITPAPAPDYIVHWTISSPTFSKTIMSGMNDPVLTNLNFNNDFGGKSGNFNVEAQITYANINEICKSAVSIWIRDEVAPVSNIIGQKNVCAGVMYTYKPDNTPTGHLFEWNYFPGGLSYIGNSINITWAAPGPYVLRVRRIVDGCYSPWLEVPITVISAQTITINGEQNVCPDQAYTYSTIAGLDSYEWSPTGGIVVGGQGTSSVTVVWQNSSLGVYRLTLRARSCGSIVTKVLNVTLKPFNANLEGPNSVCQNAINEYSIVPADPTADYTWYVDGNIINASGPSIKLQFPYIGKIDIRVRIENYMGCPGVVYKELTIEVTPSPAISISQVGYLSCKEDGTIRLVATASPPIPGVNYEWYHYEANNYVRVDSSVYATAYSPLGSDNAELEIRYDSAETGMLGKFKVVVNLGPNCTREAFYNVRCSDVKTGECGEVNIKNWEFAPDCGAIKVDGYISPECYVDYSAAFIVLTSDGYSGVNPIYINDINNATEDLRPFDKAGYYQIGLGAYYDCEDSSGGPNKRPCLDVIDVPIPFVTDFTSRITCMQGSSDYNIDLLNITSILPEFNNLIDWFWTKDGVYLSNQQNVSTASAPNSTIEICLMGSTAHPNSPTGKYECKKCQTIQVPDNLTIDISYPLDQVCVKSNITFTPVLPSGSEPIGYNWVVTHPSTLQTFSTVPAPTFGFSETGIYSIELEVIFANGCRSTVSKQIEIVPNNLGNFTILENNEPCGAKKLTACSGPSCAGYNFLWNTTPPKTTPSVIVNNSGLYVVTITQITTGCTKVSQKDVIASSPFPNGYKGQFVQCEGEKKLTLSVYVATGFIYEINVPGLLSLTHTPSSNGEWIVALGNIQSWPAGVHSFIVKARDKQTGQECDTRLEGKFTINPLPQAVPFTTTYNCEPFSATLVSPVSVHWYNGNIFIGQGNSITVFEEGVYSTVVRNQWGCSKSYAQSVSGPLKLNILEGCYCIEPDVVERGETVLEAPDGLFSYWEWRLNGSPFMRCAAPPNDCNIIPDLTLDPSIVGKITLYAERIYINSDGSTVTCIATSGEFCWKLGPCEPCTPPPPTVYNITCLVQTPTTSEYYVQWDFPYDPSIEPCNAGSGLPVYHNGNIVGSFSLFSFERQQNIWHCEGVFSLDANVNPQQVCWEMPFCESASGFQCGVSKVCTFNPQNPISVNHQCEGEPCPPETFNADIEAQCSNGPGTHRVRLTLRFSNLPTIPPTNDRPGCNTYDLMFTTSTGDLVPKGSIVRLENFTPDASGNIILDPSNYPQLEFDWQGNNGTDIICLQAWVRYDDNCYYGSQHNNQNIEICRKRFCEDFTYLNCGSVTEGGGGHIVLMPNVLDHLMWGIPIIIPSDS